MAELQRIPLDEVGTAMYTKAKTLIPGGTGLPSKRPELYLPDRWPAYYAKVSGCSVTLLLVLGQLLVGGPYRRPTVRAASGSARHAWGRDGVVMLEGAAGVGDRWSGGALEWWWR